MLLLLKTLAYIAICAALGFAALTFIGNTVEPDKREVIITLPPPKSHP